MARSASFDQRSFFTALRDVVAAAPVVRGTFVDLPSVDAVFDGSISASRIRGPARAYRQVAARCMRLVGAAIILVRDDVKGSAQRIGMPRRDVSTAFNELRQISPGQA